MRLRTTDGVIYLKDLDRCEPQSALSPLRRKHAWKVWAYEAAEFSGKMLVGSEEAEPPDEFRRYASELYRAGVSRLAFWDANARCQLSFHWTAIRRLGHVEELEAGRKAKEPFLAQSSTVLTRLGEYNMAARERLSMMTDYTPVEPEGQ